MRAQAIRPSQYITTYGAGSILEGPDGPRVVYDLEHSDVFGQNAPVTFAIHESGLSNLLPERAQIVRIPTNAEMQLKDGEAIYKTSPFPRWSLCVTHNRLYRYQHLASRTGCPGCVETFPHWNEARRKARKEAIRFVRACPAGHLDDVDWVGIITHARPNCQPESLRWQGTGGSLRNITIECPDCGGAANLGTAYAREWRCSGSYPERDLTNVGCARGARIMQRGSANLHVSELASSVTIPNLDTTLHQVLASAWVRPLLIVQRPLLQSGSQLRLIIRQLSDANAIPNTVLNEVNKYSDNMLFQAMDDVLASSLPASLEEARQNEFRQLQLAATSGHPSQPSQTPGAPPLFEVIQSKVQPSILGPGGRLLRVTPVSRLRVVMVQLGYRRMDGDLVSAAYREGQNVWLPGAELHGEGIFIDLSPQPGESSAQGHFQLVGLDAAGWSDQWQQSGELTSHPVFVWWHTLAHRLILALSVDSGYSSAAIRERIYARVDPATGAATGGILLYTAQPGGDGTLGGLIALVPRFDRVLIAALREVDSCSNDPLCSEERIAAGRANGAACYACSMVSETSCEHRNMWLDRNVLRINVP
ncbi:MAG TPA: DUF1998 domain-containing protein [Capsulimonadaceae bacterium]|jgi:hypothetical protein